MAGFAGIFLFIRTRMGDPIPYCHTNPQLAVVLPTHVARRFFCFQGFRCRRVRDRVVLGSMCALDVHYESDEVQVACLSMTVSAHTSTPNTLLVHLPPVCASVILYVLTLVFIHFILPSQATFSTISGVLRCQPNHDKACPSTGIPDRLWVRPYRLFTTERQVH